MIEACIIKMRLSRAIRGATRFESARKGGVFPWIGGPGGRRRFRVKQRSVKGGFRYRCGWLFGRVKNSVFGVGPSESRAIWIFGAVAERRQKQEIQMRAFSGYTRLGLL